jgi:hypothetical protein
VLFTSTIASRGAARVGHAVIVIGLAVNGLAGTARAEAPPATRLLPPDTLAYIAFADVPDLKRRLNETAMGQMIQNPQMRPLVDELYGSIESRYAAIQEQLGLSMGELASIPQGNVTAAIVPVNQSLAPLVLLEVGERNPALDKLLEQGGAQLEREGAVRTEETTSNTRLVVYDWPSGPVRQLAYFRKDNWIAVSNAEVLRELLARWQDGDTPSLEDHGQFATVAAGWRQAAEAPQITAFADPIGLFRTGARGNGPAQLALAILPTLGLDGLMAVAGSVSVATEQFDTLFEWHILLDSPRAGVVSLAALASGDTTPESWVPAESAGYTTLHWDVAETYKKLARLINSFQGEGVFEQQVERRINEPAGIDLAADVVPALTGRFSYLAWVERPVTLTSQGTMLGVGLKDAASFKATLDKVVEAFRDRLEAKTYGGHAYYEFQVALGPGGDGPQRPKPCFGIVGDHLLVADRESLLQKAIVTRSDASLSLAGALDYKLIASKISRLPGGENPSLVTFNRPAEGVRYLYDLASSEQTRAGLQRAGERSPLLSEVGRALENNPLPAFAVLEQYLAPGGALLTNDETGIHYRSFTLARKKK